MKKVVKRNLGILCLLLVAAVISLWSYRFFTAEKIKHVLLISIDTCRADFLRCYNFSEPTTPHIDAVAREGLLCKQAISPLPFTLPAHCSMHTGTIPPHHGVLDNGLFTLGEENFTLAEILKEEGFITGAFVSSYILDSDFGLDQGFDTYNDDFDQARNTMGILERRGGETTALALEHLEKYKDDKQFLFVHYYDPHFTYDAPEPYGSKFAAAKAFQDFPLHKANIYAAYAGEIAYVDHCIGQIVEKLKALGIYDSTLLCITSDHGEMLGEHGENTHGYFIYQGNIDVPLVFKLPGEKKGVTIEHTVGLVDIVPTICTALGIELKHKMQGKDLTAYYKDPEPYPDRYVFCQSLEPTKYNANPLLGVVTDQYKYIQTTHSELYDLGKDTLELENLFQQQPNRARLMEAELRQIIADAEAVEQTMSGSEVDTETLARLESLGYVGSAVDDTFLIDPDKDDPKEFIEYHVRTNQIGYLLQKEDYEKAEEMSRQLIESKPDQYMGYYKLAYCFSRQQRYEESIAYLLQMTKLEPDNAYGYAGLADGYRHLKQYDRAIPYALKSLELKSDFLVPYYYLSVCYYEKGLFDEPEKHLTIDIGEHPRYYKLVTALAEKLYEKGRIRQAYEKYVEVLEHKPDSLEALNSLAWFQGASTIEDIRNPQEAVRLALKACEVSNYTKAESIDTLAVAYAARGDFEKAIETAEKAIEAARSQGDAGLAGRIQKRQDLYREGRGYVDKGLGP